MLVVPSDIYAHGTQIALIALMGLPVVVLVVTLFLPTFYALQYESSYEVSAAGRGFASAHNACR